MEVATLALVYRIEQWKESTHHWQEGLKVATFGGLVRVDSHSPICTLLGSLLPWVLVSSPG